MSNIEVKKIDRPLGALRYDTLHHTTPHSDNLKPHPPNPIAHTAHLLLILFICLFPHQANTAPTCISEGCHSELQEKFLVHPEEFTCTDCHQGDFDNHDRRQ